MCGDPERRDVAKGSGAPQLSPRARPRSTRQRPRQARGSSRWKVRSGCPPAAPCREDAGNIWWGLRGALLRGRGREEGLQDFPLVKRDWQPSHPYLDPRSRVTAWREPRFLRDPNGAPQSLSYPVLLNFPACSSTLDHPLKRKGLWPLISPWPSGCRQVVPERPRLT